MQAYIVEYKERIIANRQKIWFSAGTFPAESAPSGK
jgi:hypothetical protein